MKTHLKFQTQHKCTNPERCMQKFGHKTLKCMIDDQDVFELDAQFCMMLHEENLTSLIAVYKLKVMNEFMAYYLLHFAGIR